MFLNLGKADWGVLELKSTWLKIAKVEKHNLVKNEVDGMMQAWKRLLNMLDGVTWWKHPKCEKENQEAWKEG